MSSDKEIDRLATMAAEANIATGLGELQGELVQFIDRETRAYPAAAGAGWTDDGLSAWIKEREGEMQRCFEADLAVLTGAPAIRGTRR